MASTVKRKLIVYIFEPPQEINGEYIYMSGAKILYKVITGMQMPKESITILYEYG